MFKEDRFLLFWKVQ